MRIEYPSMTSLGKGRDLQNITQDFLPSQGVQTGPRKLRIPFSPHRGRAIEPVAQAFSDPTFRNFPSDRSTILTTRSPTLDDPV